MLVLSLACAMQKPCSDVTLILDYGREHGTLRPRELTSDSSSSTSKKRRTRIGKSKFKFTLRDAKEKSESKVCCNDQTKVFACV